MKTVASTKAKFDSGPKAAIADCISKKFVDPVRPNNKLKP